MHDGKIGTVHRITQHIRYGLTPLPFGTLLPLVTTSYMLGTVIKKSSVNYVIIKILLGWIPIKEDEKNATINRIYPLEVGIIYDLGDFIKLRVTKAIHDELLCKAYSVGLILKLYSENGYTGSKPFKIGLTSDTRHDEEVEKHYKDVDIIVPHLGSIDEKDFKSEDDVVVRNENHLMLRGVVSTIGKSNAKLAIISEFGEELEEHRLTIVSALDRVFREKI